MIFEIPVDSRVCAATPQGQELKALRERIELDYLMQDIPNLMRESREGITRVRKIGRF